MDWELDIGGRVERGGHGERRGLRGAMATVFLF